MVSAYQNHDQAPDPETNRKDHKCLPGLGNADLTSAPKSQGSHRYINYIPCHVPPQWKPETVCRPITSLYKIGLTSPEGVIDIWLQISSANRPSFSSVSLRKPKSTQKRSAYRFFNILAHGCPKKAIHDLSPMVSKSLYNFSLYTRVRFHSHEALVQVILSYHRYRV